MTLFGDPWASLLSVPYEKFTDEVKCKIDICMYNEPTNPKQVPQSMSHQ